MQVKLRGDGTGDEGSEAFVCHVLTLILCVFCRDKLFDARGELERSELTAFGDSFEFFDGEADCGSSRSDFGILYGHLGVEVGQVGIGLLASHVDALLGILPSADFLSILLELGEHALEALLVRSDSELLEIVDSRGTALVIVVHVDEILDSCFIGEDKGAVFEPDDVLRIESACGQLATKACDFIRCLGAELCAVAFQGVQDHISLGLIDDAARSFDGCHYAGELIPVGIDAHIAENGGLLLAVLGVVAEIEEALNGVLILEHEHELFEFLPAESDSGGVEDLLLLEAAVAASLGFEKTLNGIPVLENVDDFGSCIVFHHKYLTS